MGSIEKNLDKGLEQSLALAGIAQCAFLVHQLAHHGMVPGDKFATAVESLFVINPKSAVEVFGRTDALKLGQQTLQEFLNGSASILAPNEVLRYIMSMLYVQTKLMQRKDLLNRISEGLERINRQEPERPYAENPEVIRQLAKLYQDSLSTLPFRIQVRGDMQRLQNEMLAAKIRVLLFAGVRAAVLWQQCGGKRWHLLFQRKRISADLKRLLSPSVQNPDR